MDYKASGKEIEASLARAEEALKSAWSLLKNQGYFSSISRSYYAVLDSTRSLLMSDGHFAKTHAGVLILFDLKYIKTKKISKKYNDIFKKTKKFREEADYNFKKNFGYKDALRVYRDAKEFLKMIKKELKKRENKIKDGLVKMTTILY